MLDEASRVREFVIRPYRPNYILPFAYNNSPNMDANLERDPDSKPQHTEAKFQISFKVKLWEDILGHIPSDKGAALERRGEQRDAAVRVLGRTHRPSNKTC